MAGCPAHGYNAAGLRTVKATSEILRFGEAFCWIEQQKVIHLKAVSRDGEPLALDAAQARKLSEGLERLATTLERFEAEAAARGE